MKVVDTDIFIDFLRGVKEAYEFIKKNATQIRFSAITESELLSGTKCNNPREREKLLHFLAQFEKIPVDNPLAQVAGQFRREYGVAMPDAIIAATATLTKSQLITRNIKDFNKIEEVELRKPY